MAAWIDLLISTLERQPVCGYRAQGAAASEPTSLAALALAALGQPRAAAPALEWLSERQAADGSVGVRAGEPNPCWPTALAVLAWRWGDVHGRPRYAAAIRRGRDWMLSMRGKTLERHEYMGHDSTIVGWPWVHGTHSWLEPTAWSVLALSATGDPQLRRVQDGRRLIADRLLTSGGCNYGNTIVLGQTLRAHVQPSGLALWALTGQADADGRIDATIDWLNREIGGDTTPTSLAYALIGLAAHDRAPKEAEAWLQAAFGRMKPANTAGLQLALLGLAAAACRGGTELFSNSGTAL